MFELFIFSETTDADN